MSLYLKTKSAGHSGVLPYKHTGIVLYGRGSNKSFFSIVFPAPIYLTVFTYDLQDSEQGVHKINAKYSPRHLMLELPKIHVPTM